MKIAGISYFNAIPYFYPVLNGHVESDFQLELTIPTEANAMLRSGKASAGLISSVEWIQNRFEQGKGDYIRIPELDIATRGISQSILLFSEKEWDEIEHVSVTHESATSVSLLKSIGRLQNRKIETSASVNPFETWKNAKSSIDGALLIGDQALEHAHLHPNLDLGELWYQETKLPMVYAVFAVRKECELLVDSIREIFSSCLSWSRNNMDVILSLEAAKKYADLPNFSPREYLENFERCRSDVLRDEGIRKFSEYFEIG